MVEDLSAQTSRLSLCKLRRTPRANFNLDSLPFEAEEAVIKTLEEILNLTWTVFGVSTLFGFHYSDKTFLKLCAKRLREEIASTLPQENVVYSTDIFVSEDATINGIMDIPPIKVIVQSKKPSKTDPNTYDEEKCIYMGIFVSWKTIVRETQKSVGHNDNSVTLPLLLCRGATTCIEAVHAVLTYMFDCLITPLPIQENDLMWLLAILIVQSDIKEEVMAVKEIRLQYIIPGLPVTDGITIKFHMLKLVKILMTIQKEENQSTNDIVTVEHIKKFHKVMQNHIKNILGIELGLCTLHRINLPVGTVMANRMKITDPEALNRVLLYFSEKALDMFHLLNIN